MRNFLKHFGSQASRYYTSKKIVGEMLNDGGNYRGEDIIEFKFFNFLQYICVFSALFFSVFATVFILSGNLDGEPVGIIVFPITFYGLTFLSIIGAICFSKKIVYIKSQKQFIVYRLFQKNKSYFMNEIDYVKMKRGGGYTFYIKGKASFVIGFELENTGEVMLILKENNIRIEE